MAEPKPWEKQQSESPRAFEAFTVYRDLPIGGRSIQKAYRAHRQNIGKPSAMPGAHRNWEHWSKEHDWTARAAAYDAEYDRLAREARAESIRKLEERRLEFEMREQERMEKTYVVAVEKLEQLVKLPSLDIKDVQRDKDGNVTSTREVSGIPATQIASLMKAAQEQYVIASLGPTKARAGQIAESKPQAPGPAVGDEEPADVEFFLFARPENLESDPTT